MNSWILKYNFFLNCLNTIIKASCGLRLREGSQQRGGWEWVCLPGSLMSLGNVRLFCSQSPSFDFELAFGSLPFLAFS